MKMIKKFIAVLLTAVTLCFACSTSACGKTTKEVDPIDDNYRVFYQIFVGSFSDSNGDGIGDLRGIINRIDYLNDGNINSDKSLGVQGIWLSPIFTSPSYHKYDAADYYTVDPKFGTEEDLKELINLCHERNVKVILDLAINHTSTQNQWFKNFTKARNKYDETDPYFDFYTAVSSDYASSGRTFKPIPGNTYNESYECNFSDDMPELNFDNEAVRSEVVNVAKHYLDIGVDGFRFDAIKYIYYGDTAKSADFWKWYASELKKIKSDVYLVGECWSADNEVIQYYDALNCFNFTTAGVEGIFAGTAKGTTTISGYTSYVTSYIKNIKSKNSDAMYCPFIANHDTDRTGGYLSPDNFTAQMTANLYILCQGSPFIYYGEEICMKGVRGAANTDANRRLAMLWGDKDTVKDPSGATYDSSKQTNGTVKSQLKDKNSLLRYYQKLIRFRNQYPQIARGAYTKLTTENNFVGGFIIEYNGETSILLHNVSSEQATIDLSKYDISSLCGFIGNGKASLNGTTLTIGGQTSVVLK